MLINRSGQLPRLTDRYKRLASVAGIAVVVVAMASTWYVATIKHDSAASLQQLRDIKRVNAQIRHEVVDSQLALNRLLLSSSMDEDDAVVSAIDQALAHSREMQVMTMQASVDFGQKLQLLSGQLDAYRSLLLDLLSKRKDLNWLYPALPFINGSMLEANERFETANLLAINELKEESENPYTVKTWQYFYETNDLWRRVIMNFRAMLIRYSGLQNVPLGASAEEQNVELLLGELDRIMTELEALASSDQISFLAQDSLSEMRSASKDWHEGFEQLRHLRLSLYWRADLQYLNNNIKPVQQEILADLNKLDVLAESLSQQEIAVVERVLGRLNALLWLVAAFIILVVVMGYLRLQKLILRPLARVANALWAESQGVTPATLSTATTVEMKQLVESFSAMRKQVNERQQALEYQALHDSLTSLPNRVLLNDRLEQQINQVLREDSSLALLIMDLNGFKEINDTLGHQIGDQVLIEVAGRIQEQVRDIDTVARMGGDEFAILLANVSRDDATRLVTRIARSLEHYLEIGGHKLHISASIGITLFPEHGHNAKILIQRSDVAMYMAKRSHTPYMFYDREQDTHNIGWLTLPAELEQALQQDHLQLYYQPKVQAGSGLFKGAEALLRWQHPRHGWINPEDIIELAESSNLIGELTAWVINRALSDCIDWLGRGIEVNLAVNLSPQNLHDPDFVTQVRELLQRYAVGGERLTLEITENAFISDPAQAVTTIHQLRDMGIRIAIDDYGTGFSSLSYLRQLAVHELKIDKVFVMNMHQNEDDVIIVRSTIQMAQSLGLQVVAEGVETAMAAQLLNELECDLLQGYLISQPLSPARFLSWLDNWEGYSLPGSGNNIG